MSDQIQATANTGIVLVVLGQLAKMLGLPKKLTPIVLLLLGTLIMCAYDYHMHRSVTIDTFVRSFVAAASAIGLYSGTKNTVQAIRQDKQTEQSQS